MAQPLHVRAALCTGAVMVLFAVLATGDLPSWLVQFSPVDRGAMPAISLPGRGGSPAASGDETGQALDLGCDGTGREAGSSGYRFRPPCAGRSVAPNRLWAVEALAGTGAVRLADSDGALLDEIPNLADGRPFVLHWSPGSDWFFVNHDLGSGHQRLRVFQIANRSVVERSALFAEATDMMVSRFPCLGRSARVRASGHGWSGDGRRIALAAFAPTDACLVRRGPGDFAIEGDWQPLWMIGDAASGRIDPASVRTRAGDAGELPSDGPYAAF